MSKYGKFEMWKKRLPRSGDLVQTKKKLGLEWTIDEFRKKNPIQKTEKALAFLLHFLFRGDQNHYSKLTSEMMKLCEQILKEDSAQFNSILFNCKKLAQLWVENDAGNAIQLKLHEWKPDLKCLWRHNSLTKILTTK